MILKNHIKEQHSDYSCIQCGECFTTKKDINSHKKKHHNGRFEDHVLDQNHLLQREKFQHCGYETNTVNELEFHMKSMHLGTFEEGYVHQKERGVCKFIRQGRCNRQRCSYRHPESLRAASQQIQFTPACLRGQTCSFLVQNRCHYFHPG